MSDLSPSFAWFTEARFGLFIHWGPYAMYGRGEQVLIREVRDQQTYEQAACRWHPAHFDANWWAKAAKRAGFRYAVLTTRHHDGYCLWDTQCTDYSAMQQSPRRDFVREFVEAFRAQGLGVGLYYSLGDWRIPAYFDGPGLDPQGWAAFRDYCHQQVRELLTNYGRIDVMWFDGAWPRTAEEWDSPRLVKMMRRLQPGMLINNRLGKSDPGQGASHVDGGLGAGQTADLGDFGTPEHSIRPDRHRPWESCQVTTWRLWGFTPGERWRPTDLLLDMLCECAEKGGNLLLNVGPDAQGQLPAPFLERTAAIGDWLQTHHEAIFGAAPSPEVLEPVTFGRVTRRDNTLYLIIRFYPPDGELYLPGLATPIRRATLLTTGAALTTEPYERGWIVRGLPTETPISLFPVVKVELDGPPARHDWYHPGQWAGDPTRYSDWARQRGPGVRVGG